MTLEDVAPAPAAAAAAPDAAPEVDVSEKAPEKERYPFTRCNGIKDYMIRGTRFELPEKYTVTARLGQGSYGMVVQALDRTTNTSVAIKKCGAIFKHPEDGKRILREIKLMQLMNHRNLLSILDVLPPTSRRFEEVYMVLPLLDTDLGSIIRSQPLSEGHCKYIAYQILRGVKYIHSANVLHRDLKPANILINFDCRIKICDFGLARGADPTRKQELTNYVVTRWYRAPELLLDNTRYNAAIDVWSIGCIFGEMLRGSALFPGESTMDQLHRVTDALGLPRDDDLWWIQSAKTRDYLKSRSGKENRVPSSAELRSLLPADIKPLANDFVRHMLTFNPYKRWSADWLLEHPYLGDCHRPESCTRASATFRWQWDSDYPSVDVLRDLFWKELAAFHPEIEERFPAPAPVPPPTAAYAAAAAPAADAPPAARADELGRTASMARTVEGLSRAGPGRVETTTHRYVKTLDLKSAVTTIRERSLNVIRAEDKPDHKAAGPEGYPVVTSTVERANCRTILQDCEWK
eukprot:EG_transcript_6740